MPDAPDAFARALDEERLRSAAWLTAIRVIAATLFVGADVALALSGSPLMRTLVPLHAAWLGVSILLWLGSRASVEVRRRSWLALPLVDLPTSLGGTWLTRPFLPAPSAIMLIGVLEALILISATQFSFRRTYIILTGALASLAIIPMAYWSKLPGGPATSVLTLGLGTALACYLPGRILSLLDRVVAERAMRDRLGRYFSPAVAQAIIAQGRTPQMVAAGEQREVTLLFADIRGFTTLAEKMDV
ncbi:MAG TPA: hypothetical protein VFF06_16950, partial [Polyangia bacterium]|nr:hypothetical protein [Polyangia bacterium]